MKKKEDDMAKAKKVTNKKGTFSKSTGKKVASKKVATKNIAAKKTKTKKSVAKKAAPKLTGKAITKLQKQINDTIEQLFTPLDNFVVVTVTSKDRVTAGGLIIPETVQQTSGNIQGSVVSVGRGHVKKNGKLVPMDVKVGDNILFPQFSGVKYLINNREMIFVRETDILGVISKS